MICFQVIHSLTDWVYEILYAPLEIIATPIRYCRVLFDSILDPIFTCLKPMSLLANGISGWIYNVYHNTLGIPQYLGIDFITSLPGWGQYKWMRWCTESRLNLIGCFVYKTLTRPLLLIPCIGWCLWLVLLPFGYLLKLHAVWTAICPVRNLEAFMAPSSFPQRPSSAGTYPLPP